MKPALFCPVLELTQQYLVRWKEIDGVIWVVSWADWRPEPEWIPGFYRHAGDILNTQEKEERPLGTAPANAYEKTE